MNIKFEYNAITEGGSELKPVMGPGKVGISNLGNYCYMGSILQALWAIPAFGHTFSGPESSALVSAPADIANDFPAQFAKVGSAIVSGAVLPSAGDCASLLCCTVASTCLCSCIAMRCVAAELQRPAFEVRAH